MRISLNHTTYNVDNGRTGYHYTLEVQDPSLLVPNETTLSMTGINRVLSQGDALSWRNDGFTESTARWVFVQEGPFTKFSYFDVIADMEHTETGTVEYCVDGDCGTVEGPVATKFDLSGTVYTDVDGSGGLYDDAVDTTLSGVTVELQDSTGAVIDTFETNGQIDDYGNYIGNYQFNVLDPGTYTVVVPDSVGEMVPTTATEQTVTITDENVTQIDFGYMTMPTYTVSGTTFLDEDRDGVWDDASEGMLGSVGPLQLIDGSGNVVAETTCGETAIIGPNGEYLGNYIFQDVDAGSYTVLAPETAGELGNLEITSPDNPQAANVADASVTGIDFGYMTPEQQPAEVDVLAYVFFDVNKNGQFDEFELGFEDVGVSLSGAVDQTEMTDGAGLADFGTQSDGDYTIEVTDGGSYGLLTYWETTTAASQDFTIDSDTESPLTFYFGYYPEPSEITTAIGNCEITGDNHTIGFWMHNVTRALMGSSRGTQVSRSDLLAYLAEVEEFGPYDEPFALGSEPLAKALWYLHPGLSGTSPLQRLDRQLLAAELNWVSGFNSSMPGLEYAMLWWAEYVRNEQPDAAGAMAEFIDTWNNLGNMDCDGDEAADCCDDDGDDDRDQACDDDDDDDDRRRRPRRPRHRHRHRCR